MAATLESLGERTGSTVRNDVATYRPPDCDWSARVRASSESRYYARWHIAIIDPRGRAQRVSYASVLAEAARVAESRVRGTLMASDQQLSPAAE